MASIIRVDSIRDSGDNVIVSSNGSGTFTNNLPSSAVNTPSFNAYMNGSQTLANTTLDPIQLSSILKDLIIKKIEYIIMDLNIYHKQYKI